MTTPTPAIELNCVSDQPNLLLTRQFVASATLTRRSASLTSPKNAMLSWPDIFEGQLHWLQLEAKPEDTENIILLIFLAIDCLYLIATEDQNRGGYLYSMTSRAEISNSGFCLNSCLSDIPAICMHGTEKGVKSEGKLSSFLPKKPPSSDTHKKTMLGLVQEESFPMLDPEGDPKGDVIVKDGQPDGIDSEGSGVIA